MVVGESRLDDCISILGMHLRLATGKTMEHVTPRRLGRLLT